MRGSGSAAAVDASAAVDDVAPVPAPEAGCELTYADHSSASRWTIDRLGGGGGGVASLRQLLIEAGHPPYNHPATAVNCRGIGTCGTCAVEVRVLAGPGTSPLTLREKLRLRLPPHSAAAAAAAAAAGETSTGKVTVRLSCQTQVLPGSTVEVRKHGGMWGQRYMPTPNHDATAAAPVPTKLGGGFDLDLIMSATPYPKWLLGEMRSNQAGETGAVAIYRGCRAALDLRSWLGQVRASLPCMFQGALLRVLTMTLVPRSSRMLYLLSSYM